MLSVVFRLYFAIISHNSQLSVQESEALALYHQALAFQKAGNTQEAEKIYLDVLQTDLLTKVSNCFHSQLCYTIPYFSK